jgi:hypothetical protein
MIAFLFFLIFFALGVREINQNAWMWKRRSKQKKKPPTCIKLKPPTCIKLMHPGIDQGMKATHKGLTWYEDIRPGHPMYKELKKLTK